MRFMKRRQAGFTLIEVTMTMAVTMIGALGVMAMNRASVRANVTSRDRMVATEVNKRWVNRLHRDALNWTDNSQVAVDQTTIFTLLAANQNEWMVVNLADPNDIAYGADWQGADVDNSDDATERRFCTFLRADFDADLGAVSIDVVTWWNRVEALADCQDAAGEAPAFYTTNISDRSTDIGKNLGVVSDFMVYTYQLRETP